MRLPTGRGVCPAAFGPTNGIVANCNYLKCYLKWPCVELNIGLKLQNGLKTGKIEQRGRPKSRGAPKSQNATNNEGGCQLRRQGKSPDRAWGAQLGVQRRKATITPERSALLL